MIAQLQVLVLPKICSKEIQCLYQFLMCLKIVEKYAILFWLPVYSSFDLLRSPTNHNSNDGNVHTMYHCLHVFIKVVGIKNYSDSYHLFDGIFFTMDLFEPQIWPWPLRCWTTRFNHCATLTFVVCLDLCSMPYKLICVEQLLCKVSWNFFLKQDTA